MKKHLKQAAIVDLEIALQDYNDSLDQVLVTSPEIRQELAELYDVDTTDLASLDLDTLDNMAWTANYLPVQPERRRTVGHLLNCHGSSRLVAIAWLAQAFIYSILIIGMM